MVSSETAAPSARSFTTTTSPGMTRMRKNTAMATPTSVGITRSRRRITYQIMGLLQPELRRRRRDLQPPASVASYWSSQTVVRSCQR